MPKKLKRPRIKKIELPAEENAITYDAVAKAMYVRLINNGDKITSSKSDNYLLVVDRREDGIVVGIEILGIEL